LTHNINQIDPSYKSEYKILTPLIHHPCYYILKINSKDIMMKWPFTIWRDSEGIPHIKAENINNLYQGLGYAHGIDRGMQILFMRLLGQGRVSEFLDSSEASLGVDKFFRKMNWQKGISQELNSLSPEKRNIIESYTRGINQALKKSFPWEFKVLGVPHDPWKGEDVFLLTRMTGYLTLSQSQGEVETLFLEMLQAGVSIEKLEALFPGILGGIDIELLKKVTIQDPVVNPSDLWSIGAPRLSASNSWVISGDMSASAAPLLSNDPHLEVNRLPNVWYEAVMETEERWAMGATMPGLPGILVGRTEDLSWGATYTFMDAEDSWIEQCRNGEFFREETGWLPFKVRKEIIKRKKKEDHTEFYYENDHGVLGGDPSGEEQYLKSTRWSGQDAGSESMDAVLGIWNARTVAEGMDCIGPAVISFNWIFADNKGGIGYQMSGKLPKRKNGTSGFVPLAGWKKENDWQGYVSYKDLPRQLNPDCGYIVTANNDLNHWGKSSPINMPMGDYRARRIESLLKGRKGLNNGDMIKIQNDLYSLEAEEFMALLKPLLPDSANGKILKKWDFTYGEESKAAFLFEIFLKKLYTMVFGKDGLGEAAERFLRNETGIYIDFFRNFNQVLLSEDSPWFNGLSREKIFRKAYEKADKVSAEAWGKTRGFTMSHIILGGQLPEFLGFDHGPLQLPGGRATVRQGQIYRSAGRITTFAPSLRIIADMKTQVLSSNLAGGASDRRFSPWYKNRIDGWIKNSSTLMTTEKDYRGKKRRF
jgi:penicillin amidase